MKAILFDMDGVIIDSELHWGIDEKAFLKNLVHPWTDKDQTKLTGMSPRGTHELLTKEYGLTIGWEAYKKGFDEVAESVYAKSQLLKGFLTFIESVKKQRLTAVASSADKKNIERIMDRFQLRPWFDLAVSAEEIRGKSKPAPDIYLHTAKKLGVLPHHCMVIEDARNGVLAAKAAGMFCVGLRNEFNNEQDLSAADIVANGFHEITTF